MRLRKAAAIVLSGIFILSGVITDSHANEITPSNPVIYQQVFLYCPHIPQHISIQSN